jgi:hypothetical protein
VKRVKLNAVPPRIDLVGMRGEALRLHRELFKCWSLARSRPTARQCDDSRRTVVTETGIVASQR